ncbi:MAG: hypothetical protein ACSLEN_14205 [Candidatus Malihini olakiniferum]
MRGAFDGVGGELVAADQSVEDIARLGVVAVEYTAILATISS